MGKILLVGAGPLATDPRASSGPSFRATQFLLPLLEAGHAVAFASLSGPQADGERQVPIGGLGAMVEFSAEAMLDGRALSALAGRFGPSAIIGCGSILPAAAAARLSDVAPTWIDWFGDPVAELQAKALAYPQQHLDTELHHVWKLCQICLRRADRMSGVSTPQVHALIGSLGQIGRVTGATGGAPMVFSIPCGLLPRADAPTGEGRRRARGVLCPGDAFVVGWGGSYNTWVDADMLFDGLQGAMERLARLHFVSTGGGSPGYNEGLYERFRRRAESSRFAQRFHFLGWIERPEAEAVHREFDVALNVDRWCWEAVLGGRNRIVNFLDLGVPVATTIVSEVSRDLEAAGAVVALPLGDARGMAATLAALADDPRRLRETAEAGQAFVREHYTFRRTVEPLLAWAASPKRAGDFRTEQDQPNPVARWTDFEFLEAELRRLWAGERRREPLVRRCLRRLRGWLRR